MGLRNVQRLEENTFHLSLPFVAYRVEMLLLPGNYDSTNSQVK